MKTSSAVPDMADMQLPTTAPLVRVTAGVGSAGQKTWNLRRPVTVIGARRPAHIVLHDKDVSAAHCVIVNTGREVLIKDLHTAHGTVCNRDKVDLSVLSDGDVVTVGATKIQVAIRADSECGSDSGANMKYVDPTALRKPLTVRFDHADREWVITEAVSLIGRHPDARIYLNIDDVERRHALLFLFGNEVALFDLAGKAGVNINGNPCPISGIRNGDRIGVGPVTLLVKCGGDPVSDASAPGGDSQAGSAASSTSKNANDDSPGNLGAGPDSTVKSDQDEPNEHDSSSADSPKNGTPDSDSGAVSTVLGELETELHSIESNISNSWQQLNGWHVRGDPEDEEINARIKSLDARENELNERDAVIRGQLHDVTRYQEQVAAREKDLEKQLAAFQVEIDHLSSAKTELEARELEVSRRMDEMRRREHVVAQRWSRLQRASCPHCGKPVRIDN